MSNVIFRYTYNLKGDLSLCNFKRTTLPGPMATARLRKAFRYPDDSGDDEHEREELDEEGMLWTC